jgi:hypothetical protein
MQIKSFSSLSLITILLYIMVVSCSTRSGHLPDVPTKPEKVKYLVQEWDAADQFRYTAKETIMLDTMYRVGDTVLESKCTSCTLHYYIIIKRAGQ